MQTHKQIFALLFLFLFGLAQTAVAQSEADLRIAELLNYSDWFSLEEEYPRLKDSVQIEMLKGLSEAMIGMYFNQPDHAMEAINSLLMYHQEDLGFGNISNLVLMKSMILGDKGLYAESADGLADFLEQVSTFADINDFPAHIAIANHYRQVRKQPKPQIIRPARDTELPLIIEEAGKGELMLVPVTIGGNKYKFIFDTGASFTFVSERFARKIGLHTTRDSILITGMESDYGKSGTIDSIMIGDIVFKNPNILIGNVNETVDTIYQVDAVLGMDFLKLVGETIIFPHQKKIIFPHHQTSLPPTGRNLMISNGQPYLKAYSGTEKLIFHFDTGNAITGLSDIYYHKHKEDVEAAGIKDTVRMGGYGGIRYIDAYKMPSIPLTIGNTNIELRDVNVLTSESGMIQETEDGSLGENFITLFEKVIINFDNMFLQVGE